MLPSNNNVNDSLKCNECNNSSLIDNKLYNEFALKICYSCKDKLPKESFDTINKTTAKELYLLNDSQLNELKFKTKSNPKRDGWIDMKLYLRFQLERMCLQIYGSFDNLEIEKQKRKGLSKERMIRMNNNKVKK